MALGDSLSRFGGTLLLVGHQRLELAALDIEEELLRSSQLLVGALMAALLAALALAALGAFVVVLFWDSARLAALGAVTLAFAAGAVFIAYRVRLAHAAKPRLLAATLAELDRDRATLREAVQ